MITNMITPIELCLRTELMYVCIIHPFVVLLSGSGSQWQQAMQGGPSVLLFSHILQLFVKDAEEFPGQMGYVIPQSCSGSASPFHTHRIPSQEGILLRRLKR